MKKRKNYTGWVVTMCVILSCGKADSLDLVHTKWENTQTDGLYTLKIQFDFRTLDRGELNNFTEYSSGTEKYETVAKYSFSYSWVGNKIHVEVEDPLSLYVGYIDEDKMYLDNGEGLIMLMRVQ